MVQRRAEPIRIATARCACVARDEPKARTRMKANLRSVVGVSLMLSALGCASGRPPTERMTSARAAVRSAQELGSSGVPKADLHVKLAQEQIEFAHKLIEDGEN